MGDLEALTLKALRNTYAGLVIRRLRYAGLLGSAAPLADGLRRIVTACLPLG